MEILGDRAQPLPAPPHVVFGSLVDPERAGARPWLNLLEDEVPPVVLHAAAPHQVRWSPLWPSRPNDVVDFKRLNHLLFADLRHSYGQ